MEFFVRLFAGPANSAPIAPSSASTTRARCRPPPKSSTSASADASPGWSSAATCAARAGDAVLLADLTGAPCERVIVVGLGATQRLQAQAVPQGARERARRCGAHRREGCGELSRPRRRRRCRHLHAGAHRRGSRGELAVPHPRSQDRQQAAEAVAGQASASRSPDRGERGNAERAIAHGEGIVAGMA